MIQLVLVVGRLTTEASGFRSEHFGCVCLRCPQEQTQIPLEACLAWTILEERADYSRRGEMTKHDLTPLSVENSPPRTTALTPVNIMRGENVVIMSATKEKWQLGRWCHFMPALRADVELFGQFLHIKLLWS